MTFSVDLDLWPTQKGPAQDATSRAGTGEGRGKDFASSLLGVPADSIPEAGRSLFAGPADALTPLNTVNLLAARPDPGRDISLTPAASVMWTDAAEAPSPAIAPDAPAEPAVLVHAKEIEPDPAIPANASDVAPEPATPVKAEEPEAANTAEVAKAPLNQPAPSFSVDAGSKPEISQVDLTADASVQDVTDPAQAIAPAPAPSTDEPEPGLGDLTGAAGTLPVATAAPEMGPAAATSTQQDTKISEVPRPEAQAAMATQTGKSGQPVERASNSGQLVFEGAGAPEADPASALSAAATANAKATEGKTTTHANAVKPDDAAAATSDELSPLLPDNRSESGAAMTTVARVDTAPSQGGVTSGSDAIAPSSSSAAPSPFGPATGHSTITAQAPLSQPALQTVPTHTVMVATASELPGIVARATSEAQDDRVVVQLDPPELGRVSIDFKFDGQGLQHVTITAETPEAMRQLRQMHFELTQALERNGLSGQSMSFQHQNPQQDNPWGQQARMAGARFDTPVLSGNGLVIAADSGPGRQTASGGRLDIRL